MLLILLGCYRRREVSYIELIVREKQRYFIVFLPYLFPLLTPYTKKKWFCHGNKIKDNFFFVAATKNFAAATKRFVDRTKHFVVTKYFAIPILRNNLLV